MLCKKETQPVEVEEVADARNQLNENFDLILLTAVDEAFSLLGEHTKKAIYAHLEKRFKIKKEEIPNKLVEFSNALETIFGLGAKIIEMEIMRNLYRKINEGFKYFPKEENLTFIDYVKAVEKHLTMALERSSLIYEKR